VRNFKVKYNCPLIFILCSLNLIACAESTSADNSVEHIMPNIVEFPALPGSKSVIDCKSEGLWPESFGQIACVTFPTSSVLRDNVDWQKKYRNQLESYGWKMTMGFPPLLNFEKPIPDTDCNEALLVLGKAYIKPEEMTNSRNIKMGYQGLDDSVPTLSLVFISQTEKKCGTKRTRTIKIK